jgi:regulator of protease activity HflC (stomatin/prohibitin superfamily)
MGFTRKVMSVGSLGLVDFRSDKERTAAYTKAARNEARRQTAVMRQQAKAARQLAQAQQAQAQAQAHAAHQQWLAQQHQAQAAAAAQQPQQRSAVPGWYNDGAGLRWWDGQRWTEHRA